MGIIGKSAFLSGMGMIALGLGLLFTYIRMNSKSTYKVVSLPKREDDTVELSVQPDNRDHSHKE